MVNDDELEADPVIYDCEACPVRDALDGLAEDQENHKAWLLWRQVVSRFTVDTHLTGLVLTKLAGELDAESFSALIERFAILYEALCPPPQTQQGS